MRQIGERQRQVWMLAGASAIAAATLCGLGWLWVLAGSLAASIYYYYIDTRLGSDGLAACLHREFGFWGNVLCAFALFWVVLVMGWCACLADSAFPQVDGFPGLGWVVLALAAWGSKKGARACAGCSGILSLFLLVLYGTVIVFSVPNIRTEYLKPAAQWKQAFLALGLLLLPAGVWCVPLREKKGTGKAIFLALPITATALAAATAGVLSPELAAEQTTAVYNLAQSVSVFGVAERIEPLVSVAMTMGVFCLLTSLAVAGQSFADQLVTWKWSGSACCFAAAIVMYYAKSLPKVLIIGGNFVFFLVLPMAICAFRKKSKN